MKIYQLLTEQHKVYYSAHIKHQDYRLHSYKMVQKGIVVFL